MGGTGHNLTLGVEMTKQTTGGIWRGGTHYILTPQKEILNIGEAETLRPYLEDSLKVSKGKTQVIVDSQELQNGVTFSDANSLEFQVAGSGKYTYAVYSMNGKTLLQPTSLRLSANEVVSINPERLAHQVVILCVTTPSGLLSKTFLVKDRY